MLSADEVASRLEQSNIDDTDPFVIAPKPQIKSGSASIDLRLGTWFVTSKARRHHVIDVYSKDRPKEYDLSSKYYIPFDKAFILHPRHFVLAVTLEWIRMPWSLAGYVTGKSSWGRYGLIIETAPGVQPGFTGCLTLEMSNIGEIPIAIKPGSRICQLFLHKLEGEPRDPDKSQMNGRRQPFIGTIELDEYEKKLRKEN